MAVRNYGSIPLAIHRRRHQRAPPGRFRRGGRRSACARGWGRDVMSLALAVQNLTWGVVAVVAGGITNRYGNLRVLLAGWSLLLAH